MVQDIHSSFTDIESKTFEQESAFSFCKEGCGFRPVHNNELEYDSNEDCEQAFNYEDPTPTWYYQLDLE